MSGKRPVSNETKLLDAISTLKRITGIPSSTIKPDAVEKDLGAHVTVCTTDHECAVLMANLISQCIMKCEGHTEQYWRKRGPDGPMSRRHGYHEGILPINDGVQGGKELFRIRFTIPEHWIRLLAKNITEKSESLI